MTLLSTDHSTDDSLAARYGRRQTRPGRRGIVVLVAVAVATAVVLGWWWYSEGSQPTLEYAPAAYVVISDTSVRVTFSVTKDKDATVTCRIIAQDEASDVIGTQDVTIGAGTSTSQHTVTLVTRGRAVLGTVDSCAVTG